MSKTAKSVIWMAGYLVLCWLMYQLLGWLGLLMLVLAGIVGGIAAVFINRKITSDQRRSLP